MTDLFVIGIPLRKFNLRTTTVHNNHSKSDQPF
jgi:hypothetical protein